MSILSAMVSKAVKDLWDAHGLEWEFKKYWTLDDRDFDVALNDTEGGPEQPHPFCVFEQEPGSVETRMSGDTSSTVNREEHIIPFQFRIHAKRSENNTGKEIAVRLMEFVIMKFGGHPSVKAKKMTLDNGFVPYTQLVNEFGARTGDEEYQWTINYNIHIDTPVAA